MSEEKLKQEKEELNVICESLKSDECQESFFLQEKIQNLSRNLQESELEVTELGRLQKVSQDELNALKSKETEAGERFHEVTTELKGRLEVFTSENNEMRIKFSSNEEESAKLKAELKESHDKTGEVEERNQLLRGELSEVRACEDSLKTKLANLQEENETLTKLERSLKMELSEKMEELAASQDAVESLEVELNLLSENVRNSEVQKEVENLQKRAAVENQQEIISALEVKLNSSLRECGNRFYCTTVESRAE